MAIRALNPCAPFWWTPPEEEGKPNPTKFRLRGLDGNEQGYVWPEVLYDPVTRVWRGFTGKGLEMVIGYGLLDWENVENDGGKVACVPGNFGLLRHPVRIIIAVRIWAASFPDPEEKKT